MQKIPIARIRASSTVSSFDGVGFQKKIEGNLIYALFVMPSPLNDELAGEISAISAELDAMYGTGEHCFEDDDCYDLEAFESIIDNSRDPAELKSMGRLEKYCKPMKDMYLRMVEIGNQGANDLVMTA